MLPEIIPNWHPIFIHFTIALFTISTLLIVSSLFIRNDLKAKILDVGYVNLWLGCILTFASVAAGFYAYNTVAHDEPSHMAMTNHKNWALITAVIFLILTLWSIKLYRSNNKQNFIFIMCLIIATSFLSITGWKGGEIVYRYGLGVKSLPNTDSHQHEEGKEMPANHENMQNPIPYSAAHKEEAKHDNSKHSH